MFLIAHDAANDAHKHNDDLAAIREWQEFDEQIKDPDDRKWHLLAVWRVKELEDAIKDRRQLHRKEKSSLPTTPNSPAVPKKPLTIRNQT